MSPWHLPQFIHLPEPVNKELTFETWFAIYLFWGLGASLWAIECLLLPICNLGLAQAIFSKMKFSIAQVSCGDGSCFAQDFACPLLLSHGD